MTLTDMRRRSFLALPLLALLATLGCSESGPFVPTIEGTTFASSLNVDLANSTRTASGLYYRDITVGGGTAIPATGTVNATTAYEGYLRNGTLFDDGSFTFATGTGQVIAGYDEGVRGMRVGGVRQVIIPPNLGYGAQVVGGIPKNSILVFFITLTAVN